MGIGELKSTFVNNRGKRSFGVGRSENGGATVSGGMFRCCSCRGTAHQGTLRIAQCTNFRSSLASTRLKSMLARKMYYLNSQLCPLFPVHFYDEDYHGSWNETRQITLMSRKRKESVAREKGSRNDSLHGTSIAKWRQYDSTSRSEAKTWVFQHTLHLPMHAVTLAHSPTPVITRGREWSEFLTDLHTNQRKYSTTSDS